MVKSLVKILLFKNTKSLLLIFFTILPILCPAQLKPAKIFTNNMVLQRNEPIRFWGKARPGESLTVLFANEKRNLIVQNDSSWTVIFNKQRSNSEPQSVIFQSGNEKVELTNLLIGDVWLCIGQSNMEWPMVKELHYKNEIEVSNQTKLRFYNPTYAGKNTFNVPFSDSIIKSLNPENFYKGEWQTCDKNSFKQMSAVAYYFGKNIIAETDVPVGLIHISIGGAPLETFINLTALKNSRQFSDKTRGDWLLNNSMAVWIRERGNQNIGDTKNIPQDANGKNHAFKPGFAYQSGIEPILNMPIKGILCYQGESNAQEIERVNEFAALSALMIEDYRKQWKNPQLPFYFVQLSSIDTLKYKGQLWPKFRDEQRKMLQLIPNSGMAVTSDIGFKNDVHPTNKKNVGERLARWALKNTYHKNIVPSGPLPLKAIYKHDKLIIKFQFSGDNLLSSDGKPLRGFSVDGINECEASIQNKTIVIPVLEKPIAVYYGWKSFTDANLVNSEKLPASTFKIRVK
jgi:sialate O-acetylesterase